jgi:hypothetical protein
MDEMIVSFIDNYFSDEAREDIYKSFSLFDLFEHQNAYSGFVDIITNASYVTSDSLKDCFVNELNKQLDYVLKEHTVILVPDATIEQKNAILHAFGLLQYLEDYTSIILTLESLTTDEEQLSSILSGLSGLDEMTIISIVEFFDPDILQQLKKFIYIKESEEKMEVNSDLIHNLKVFFKLNNREYLGVHLLKNNVLLGAKFESYLQYFENEITVGTPEEVALNILSIIYMSEDGYKEPLLTYREHSLQLLHDVNKVSAVEVLIIKLVNSLEEYKKALNEKNRISSTSSHA